MRPWNLLIQKATDHLGYVLAEAYFATGLTGDYDFRIRIIDRISECLLSYDTGGVYVGPMLHRFPTNDVAPIANKNLGINAPSFNTSEELAWLRNDSKLLDYNLQLQKLLRYKTLGPNGLAEIAYLLHCKGDKHVFRFFARNTHLYTLQGPEFPDERYVSQAEVAFVGLVAERRSIPAYALENVNYIFSSINQLEAANINQWLMLVFIRKIDSRLSKKLHILSHEVCSFCRNFRFEEKIKGVLPDPLRRESATALCQAFAERIEQAAKLGHDPGWPENLPEAARVFLEKRM